MTHRRRAEAMKAYVQTTRSGRACGVWLHYPTLCERAEAYSDMMMCTARVHETVEETEVQETDYYMIPEERDVLRGRVWPIVAAAVLIVVLGVLANVARRTVLRAWDADVQAIEQGR